MLHCSPLRPLSCSAAPTAVPSPSPQIPPTLPICHTVLPSPLSPHPTPPHPTPPSLRSSLQIAPRLRVCSLACRGHTASRCFFPKLCVSLWRKAQRVARNTWLLCSCERVRNPREDRRDLKVNCKTESGPLLGLCDARLASAQKLRTGGRMTIRPGQPSRKSPPAGTTKSSAKGMDVVMNDFEQRHHTNKSRSHSPFGHIGSPTTPLNFEQLFLQGQLPLNSELSQHDQTMLQAQLLNSMRSTGMAPKPKQQSQPSLAMLDQLRAYNRGEQEQAFSRGDREQADWNARALSVAAAAHQQQHQGPEIVSEPSSIALLQQKFAQLERHKAEMQKSASHPQQGQIYSTQWPMSVQPQLGNSMQPPPPVSSGVYPESRHFVPTSGGFYSFQQHQPSLQTQVMPPPNMPEVPDQFFSAKQEISWRPTQDTRPAGAGQGWNHGNAGPPSISEMGNIAPLVYMTQQQGQQFQHQAPKVVDYQSTLQHRVPDFAVPPQASFNSFQLNGPPAPDMALLGGPVGVSSRCDKTGGHSVEIKSVPDHYRTDDSEMSLDNFSGRVSAHIPQPSQVQTSIPIASQIPFSNSFHMLPQSSKSAFSTFTRPSSNLNPASEAVVTKSLLFNDTYRRSQEMPDLMHADVDTELHL